MKNKPNTNTHTSTTTQMAAKAKSIKLGIDVHADSYRVGPPDGSCHSTASSKVFSGRFPAGQKVKAGQCRLNLHFLGHKPFSQTPLSTFGSPLFSVECKVAF